LHVKTPLPQNIRTKKPKTLLHGYSPPTSPPPLKSGPWSLKKKWHPPSTMTPNYPITGVSTQGTKCLGQTPMPSPPDFFNSPSAIPPTMKTPCSLATRHAIYSAAISTEETATFMFLPSWNNRMTTNPYISLNRRFPHIYKFLGSIPSGQL